MSDSTYFDDGRPMYHLREQAKGKKPEKKPYRIPRVGKDRGKQNRRLKPLRDHYENLGDCCVCGDFPVEIHEIAARSKSDDAVEHPDNWLRLCRTCHDQLQHTDKEEQIIVKLHHIVNVINELCGNTAVTVKGITRKLLAQMGDAA